MTDPALRHTTQADRDDRIFGAKSLAAVEGGEDPATIASLAALVRVETVRRALTVLIDRAGNQKTLRSHYLAYTMHTIAKYHVKADEAHLKKLSDFSKSLKPKSQGLAPKNRARLRQFDDPEMVAKLLHLPGQMLAEAEKTHPATPAEARIVQTAVAIEILLVAPIRNSNLTQLKLDETLVFGPGGMAHIVIGMDAVKNENDIEIPLPDSALRMLRIYLDRYHGLLAPAGSPWLFPRRAHGHKAFETLAKQMGKALRQRIGIVQSPHGFRHLAAKLYLAANPGGYGVVKLLLGHKSIETTIRFYCGEESAAAFRHYDAHILNLREGAEKPPLRRRKRAEAKAR